MSEKYNGYTNWETWSAALWADSSGNYDWYRKYAIEHKVSVEDIADMLENEMWDAYDQIPTGFFSDIVSNAVNAINFTELAEKILEGVNV